MKCIFSVDVEDWFHILGLSSTPCLDQWSALPGRVERNFQRLLEIFAAHRVQVTCFFLGWIAERYPHLVREALACGHEIASHGYAHRLAYSMDRREFEHDAVRAKCVIEDVAGCPVSGFRAPGFSATESVPWFFDALAACGYEYDSSVFPAPHGHGGLPHGPCEPYRCDTASGPVVEFPISVARTFGRAVCFFGGGYLRLFPRMVIEHMAQKVLDECRPVVFYIHPREIDPEQPRLKMGRYRSFKSYVNLHSTEPKIHSLLARFDFASFREFLHPYHAPAYPQIAGRCAPADAIAGLGGGA